RADPQPRLHRRRRPRGPRRRRGARGGRTPAPRPAADGGRRGADLSARARVRRAGAGAQRGAPRPGGRHVLSRLGPLAVARGATGAPRRLRHRVVGTPMSPPAARVVGGGPRASRPVAVVVTAALALVVSGCGSDVYYRGELGGAERVPATA